MLRQVLGISEPDLERELLRKGVDHRASGRERCADCGRTPLVGERMHHYEHDGVCDLCREARPARPLSSVTVHHAERGLSVRVRRRGLREAA